MEQLSFSSEGEVNNTKDTITYYVTDALQPKSAALQILSSLYYAIEFCCVEHKTRIGRREGRKEGGREKRKKEKQIATIFSQVI